ncbi:MAG TPA: hypothetical protein VNQ77_00495 [Frankiaceae bacterium]|nr:hypothetical protein [Frankiaceae bacterium]
MRRTLLAVLLATALAAPAHAAPPTRARWAASWLAGRVTPAGYVTALDGKPDLATSVVIGLALAAAGTAPKTLDAIARYAAAHADEYATANGTDRPGALGRLAMLAKASGRDPNAFGGTEPRHRLVDRILATRTTLGPSAGLLADPVYNGVFSHSLGLLGVAAARSLTDEQRAGRDAALDYLVAQQCADGGWQNNPRVVVAGLALTQCGTGQNGPDTNVASFAAQAIAAHGRTATRDPLAWWDAAQNAAGGWGYLPGGATDADSTALAIQALVASGASPTDKRFTGKATAYAALLALQLGCGSAKAERGAFAYMKPASGPPRPNVYATAEAVPAVARLAFPLHRPVATVARASVPC